MTAWLTGTLLYTGLLIALVLLVRRPFSRWFGPQFAYALWALPALRLLLPPIELPASMAPQQAQQLSDQALLALAMATEASPTAAPAAHGRAGADAAVGAYRPVAHAVARFRGAVPCLAHRQLLPDAPRVARGGASRW